MSAAAQINHVFLHGTKTDFVFITVCFQFCTQVLHHFCFRFYIYKLFAVSGLQTIMRSTRVVGRPDF